MQIRKFSYLAFGLVLLVTIPGCTRKQTGLSSVPQGERVQFGGSYDQLAAPQQELIDDWFANIEKMLGKPLPSPEEEYNQLPLSTRTTFEAVTHSLVRTPLTDKNGNRLGTGIDLVQHLETIRGHIPNARGDLQFRIYVTLKPDAREKLTNSVEFQRTHDNTIYHHGFPYSYRLAGTPSTQFSITEDFSRADIDVDYRSSSFPVVLFNGHLTASNSDVRMGKNYQTHLERWDGLPDWWRDFLTLIEGNILGEASSDGEYYIPPVPPISKDATIVETMDDYLETWLEDRDPRTAAAFHSGSVIRCFDPIADGQDELNLARYRLVARMMGINELIPDDSDVEDIVHALEPQNPALIRVEHPSQERYTLVHVPRELASVLTCGAMGHPEDAHLLPVGDYYGTFFEIKESNNQFLDVFQLWGKEEEYWKLLSYHIALESRDEIYDLIPDRWEIPASNLERISGDPSLLESADRFFQSWIQDGNYDQALTFMSEDCYHCPQHYDFKGKPEQISLDEAHGIIEKKLKMIRDGLDVGSSLQQAIRRVEPWNPSLKVISHDQEEAYTLVSVPDGFAEPLLCENRHRAHEMERSEEHGSYMASLFQTNVRSDHPAAMILLWSKDEDSNWKIVSYHIESH
jgi:hypothetical protein